MHILCIRMHSICLKSDVAKQILWIFCEDIILFIYLYHETTLESREKKFFPVDISVCPYRYQSQSICDRWSVPYEIWDMLRSIHIYLFTFGIQWGIKTSAHTVPLCDTSLQWLLLLLSIAQYLLSIFGKKCKQNTVAKGNCDTWWMICSY